MPLKTQNNPNPQTLLKQTCISRNQMNLLKKKPTYPEITHVMMMRRTTTTEREDTTKNNNNSTKNINNKGKQTYASNRNPSGSSTTRKK
jgi:hypothetical protein